MPPMGILFQPYRTGSLNLHNRIVMAPMTREQAPGGVVGAANTAYYRRRVEAGVGLVITEGMLGAGRRLMTAIWRLPVYQT